MYNLTTQDLNKYQNFLLNYYNSDKGMFVKEISFKKAIEVFDRITENKAKNLQPYEKTNIIEYLHRDLINDNKLKYKEGYYKVII